MKYIVTITWEGGKETKYIAPSHCDSCESAAFWVALTWHMDFLTKSADYTLRPKGKIKSIIVTTEEEYVRQLNLKVMNVDEIKEPSLPTNQE